MNYSALSYVAVQEIHALPSSIYVQSYMPYWVTGGLAGPYSIPFESEKKEAGIISFELFHLTTKPLTCDVCS